jgi:hypothetical protein
VISHCYKFGDEEENSTANLSEKTVTLPVEIRRSIGAIVESEGGREKEEM